MMPHPRASQGIREQMCFRTGEKRPLNPRCIQCLSDQLFVTQHESALTFPVRS